MQVKRVEPSANDPVNAADLMAQSADSSAQARTSEERVARPFGWQDATEQVHHRYLWPSIQRLLPVGGPLKILDLGCGNGQLSGRLAQLGHDVVGVDRSPDGLDAARPAFPDVRFVQGSVYDDVRDAPGCSDLAGFDVVLASEVIEHLYAPRDFLANARQHLVPGGALLLTTPYHGYLKNLALALANAWDHHLTVGWDGGHIKFFSQRTLGAMLRECGFRQPQFANAGRAPLLWKSMCCRSERDELA